MHGGIGTFIYFLHLWYAQGVKIQIWGAMKDSAI